MGKRPGVLVAVGGVLLLVGAAIVFIVLRDDGPKKAGASQSVLVATAPLAAGTDAGTAVAQGKIALRQVDASRAAPGVITSVAAATGMKLVSAVAADDQITSSVLQVAGARPAVITIPKGKQAVAVTAGYTAAGAGYVEVGDQVSVYALIPPAAPGATGVNPYAKQLIGSALVLDVSTSGLTPGTASPSTTVAGASGNAGQTLTLLLALTPAQAEQVAFATTFDLVYVSILAKGDTPPKTPGVGYGHNYVEQPS